MNITLPVNSQRQNKTKQKNYLVKTLERWLLARVSIVFCKPVDSAGHPELEWPIRAREKHAAEFWLR